MSRLERQQNILRLLSESARSSLTVGEIADTLFYSESSIRRDIRDLASHGLVQHLWGGVMLASGHEGIVPVRLREDEHGADKEKIAEAAAALVRDGDTVMMDSSSTVYRMLRYLSERQNLRIITNNRRIFDLELPQSFHLYCTGGSYRPDNHNFCGAAAEKYVRLVRADILFFSSQGIGNDGIISDVSEEETSLRRAMMSSSARRVFLCDSSKIGITRQFVLCSVTETDDFICDRPEMAAKIRNALDAKA